MEEIKVTEMLQADSINKDDSVMIIQEGVNKKASGSIQTATGNSLSLTSVADTCKVKSNSKNLFDENIEQGTVSSTGLNQASTTRLRSVGYIPVKPDTSYTISLVSTNITRASVSYYTTNDYTTARTNSPSWTNLPATFTTDSTTKYIRFIVSTSTGSDDVAVTDVSNIQVEEGSTATSYNPYNTKVLVRTKNLITNIIEGYALSSNTGAIAENSERAVTDFIEVEPNTEYVRSGYSTTGTVFYKADKSRISNNNSNPFTTPSGTKYVRLGINSTLDYSQAQLEKGSTATSYAKGKNQEISLTPQEEKVAFTYDSLTNVISDGSVTIEYATKGRLLNNDDTLAIKEYVDREMSIDEYNINLSYTTIASTYQFFKSNGIATITAGNIWTGASLSANSWFDIGTIPSACIPKTQVTFNTAISDGYNGRVISYGKGSVTTDGKIRVMVSSALTSQNTLGLNFSVTYLTN